MRKKNVIRKHQPINHIIENRNGEWNIFQRDVIDISILLSVDGGCFFSIRYFIFCWLFFVFSVLLINVSCGKSVFLLVFLSYPIYFFYGNLQMYCCIILSRREWKSTQYQSKHTHFRQCRQMTRARSKESTQKKERIFFAEKKVFFVCFFQSVPFYSLEA